MRFPYFFRTVPNELSQYEGVAQLLHSFGWSWVGILATDDDSGERAVRELKAAISRYGGCVEFSFMLPSEVTEDRYTYYSVIDAEVVSVINAVSNSTSQVIILYGTGTAMTQYLAFEEWLTLPNKIWIASVSFSFLTDAGYGKYLQVLNGTLAFAIRKNNILGFKDVLNSYSPSQFPESEEMLDLWEERFDCRLKGRDHRRYRFSYYMLTRPLCSGNETMKSLDSSIYDVSNFRFTYSMYTAVYALAHALHDMLSSDSRPETVITNGGLDLEIRHWKVILVVR
ncbi:hypothetical protein NDU88_000492 [Pleurodeles waltl]|uniref:Receptor ligand binding region domain-containing protein n=1 Tax=Pleurodeles waltl TaxID=8319 RepID=A0AAV7WHQ9_PLEWA|nr:hypothetical protein NDU88_000492 [Pleurodeles waltl]